MAKAKSKTTEVESTKNVAGKTVYGLAGLSAPTPKWATWLFRGEFLLNKAIGMFLGGTHVIPADQVKEYLLLLAVVDFIFWGFARQVGIQKPTE